MSIQTPKHVRHHSKSSTLSSRSVNAQEATPSAADAAKRADLVRRLGNLIASGVAGYTGLRAEVPQITLPSLTLCFEPPLSP